jgi:adenine-specific DNA-methyltransferase
MLPYQQRKGADMSDAKEQARQEIAKLVERFRAFPEKERSHYNEAQMQQSFILPLFRALGWDIENPREVTAEEHVAKGFVDFGFYLNGIPVFYLETKKIPAQIRKPDWAWQAINYSWLKGVTWAVLTDFTTLYVLNSDWRELPFYAQFLSLTWEKYTSNDFDDLWLLSKESMQAHEIDAFAERVGAKKRRVKPTVQEALFSQMTEWRRALFAELKGFNGEWQLPLIDEAVQRLIDRLIFIRTMEDREIEPNRLKAISRQYQEKKNKKANIFSDLQGLFKELDNTYNARLFSTHALDKMEMHAPDLIETIIEGLYTAKGGYAQYDFHLIDSDVLGAVYEQYLGFKLQDPEGKQAIDLSKRTKRKSQGIYYTPQFVVRYIVRQTLGKLLEDGVDPHTIRVLDPACGSGSFLIEAFDVLDRHLALNGTDEDKADPRARRLRILQENIYGVDLDPQAVEVARLNLLLRTAVEREKLPMLNNIREGNSLIDDPAIAGASAFNWQEQFPEVMNNGGFDVIIGNPPYIRAETMPKTHREYWQNSGYYKVIYGRFDIFILFMEQAINLLNSTGKLGYIVPSALLNQNYAKVLRGKILESSSINSIVDSSEYKIFQDASVPTIIITLTKEPEALVRNENSVLVIIQEEYSKGIEPQSNEQYFLNQSIFTTTPNNMFRLELTAVTLDLVRKIEKDSLRFGDICTVITGVVAHDSTTGASKDRLINTKPISSFSKPYIEAKEVGETRYASMQAKRYIEYIPKEMHRPKFPELFESEKILIPDIVGMSGLTAILDRLGIYTNHSFNCCVLKHYLLDVSQRLQITKVDAEISRKYSSAFLVGIINSRLISFYFLKVLGGKMHASPESIRSLPIRPIDFDNPDDVAKHNLMVSLVDKMIVLKKEYADANILFADSRHDLAHQIERLDAEIDKLVYDLYGLSEDEIAIVEGKG